MDKHNSPSFVGNEYLRPALLTMRAMAHPLRLKMLHMIDQNGGTANVGEIFTGLGIEQSIASQHLRILRLAELVKTRRDRKFIYYSLDYARIERAVQAAKALAPGADLHAEAIA